MFLPHSVLQAADAEPQGVQRGFYPSLILTSNADNHDSVKLARIHYLCDGWVRSAL